MVVRVTLLKLFWLDGLDDDAKLLFMLGYLFGGWLCYCFNFCMIVVLAIIVLV